MLGAAALLAARGALLLGRRWQVAARSPLGALTARSRRERSRRATGLIYETESAYQYIQIVERTDGSRVLQLNEGVAVHSVCDPDTRADRRRLGHVPRSCRRCSTGPSSGCSIIGNAGGTIARAYGELYPDVADRRRRDRPRGQRGGARFFGLGDNPQPRT